MSVVAKQYLDLAGLSAYDALIKDWANSANQAGYKSIIKSADGNSLLLYKEPNITINDPETAGYVEPDDTIALGSQSASDLIDALAAVVGATQTNEGTYTLGLGNTFDANTDTVVEALNELKGQINTLNADDSTSGSVAKAIKDAIEDLDTSADVTIVSKSGKAITITADIAEVDGVIQKGAGTDITLADVASTGNAEDVANTEINGVTKDVGGTPTATTNVQDTLAALKGLIDNANTDGTLYAVEGAGSGDVLKSYTLYQGGTPTVDQDSGKVTAVTGGDTIVTINIPKDYLVKDAGVSTVVAADKEADGKFENDSDFAVGDKYIDFTVNTVGNDGTATHLYINVDDLMAALSVEANAAEIQLALSGTNQLSASVVDIAASKITYVAAVAGVGSEGDPDYVAPVARESVGAALLRLDGAANVTGSVAQKIQTAVAGLDTANDVAIATYDSTNDVVTLVNGISETDGVIGEGTGDGITIGAIGSSDINALFTTPAQNNGSDNSGNDQNQEPDDTEGD